jgi:hypothetical protein
MQLTEKEGLVLLSIYRNDYTAFNGGHPKAGYVFNADDWQVWSADIDASPVKNLPKGRALSALVSSLVQKGAVTTNDECVVLTQAGYDAAVALEAPAR